MKKIYAFAAAAMVALTASAQEPLYITGNGAFANGQWNAETPDQFEYVDGQYKITVDNLSSFKMSTACGDWDTFNTGAIGYESTDKITQEMLGKEIKLGPWGENNTLPAESTWEIAVKGDLSAMVVTNKGGQLDTTVHIYLRGDMNDWANDEAVRPAWEMTVIENEVLYSYVCNGTPILAGQSFKFADATWGIVNLGLADGDAIAFDEPCPLEGGANPASITLDEEWDGVIYLDLPNKMVFFSNDKEAENPFASGVAAVAAENGAAKYFNLQGVEVSEPANGLYIVVKNGKAVKVVK
ncbi:MAG: hypothetical protein K2M87_00560 [Muribaculaceae bacterium]|nr:hypothetical protein [Muribaculaceae bacterium]